MYMYKYTQTSFNVNIREGSRTLNTKAERCKLVSIMDEKEKIYV